MAAILAEIKTSEVTAGGGIVDMAADIDIIGRVEFSGGGIFDGMDNAVVDWHNVAVDVGEVGTGGGVVVTIQVAEW